MAHAIWKGEISFGLVSIPVSLVSTEAKHDIPLHLLNSKTNSRIRFKRVDEETGKEIPWSDIIKGYEYEKDAYLIVNEDAFEKASPELFKTIAIEEFVNHNDIDTLFYNKPYFLIPEGKTMKAYVLLREALKKTNKVGIAKTILRSKEYLSIISPHDHSLLLFLIHFSDEIRSEVELNVPKETIQSYKISDKELKMAEDLIKDMSNPWEPEKYHNDYRETLQTWLDKQVASLSKTGKKRSSANRRPEAITDFVALLKESMKRNIQSTPKKKGMH